MITAAIPDNPTVRKPKSPQTKLAIAKPQTGGFKGGATVSIFHNLTKSRRHSKSDNNGPDSLTPARQMRTIRPMTKSLLTLAMSAALATSAIAENEFRHVVMFAFKPDATAEQVKEIEKEFAKLPSKIDTITGYEWGLSESVEQKNDGFTHCFLVSFKDKAGLETYIPHESHQAFVAKLRPILEKALVFDYTAKKD